jgi:DNA polymerase-3 subunit gamma/tau
VAAAQPERSVAPPRQPTPWEAISQAASGATISKTEPKIEANIELGTAVGVLEPPQNAVSVSFDLDSLRDRICDALETSGHNTAAALLSSGAWSEADGKVRVEVGIKKTMLGLTMNAEAEKILKSAAREAGFAGVVAVVSAANGTEATNGLQPPAKRPAPAGSLQAEALAHPLVKRALELFDGEVRSVLDLREKKNA